MTLGSVEVREIHVKSGLRSTPVRVDGDAAIVTPVINVTDTRREIMLCLVVMY
jgi:hypothetical protein